MEILELFRRFATQTEEARHPDWASLLDVYHEDLYHFIRVQRPSWSDSKYVKFICGQDEVLKCHYEDCLERYRQFHYEYRLLVVHT